MTNSEIIEILKDCGALMEGHFKLSSGRHSNRYVQCAKVLRFPKQAEKVLGSVVESIQDMEIDKIVGPAMGGVIVSYELGRQLDKEAVFTERKEGKMQLRRGFEILKGSKVLISEDVITTGKSTLEVIELLSDMGAIVVGAACIVDRRANDVNLGVPVFSAVKIDIDTYSEEDCPLCRKGIEIKAPGSRFSKEK